MLVPIKFMGKKKPVAYDISDEATVSDLVSIVAESIGVTPKYWGVCMPDPAVRHWLEGDVHLRDIDADMLRFLPRTVIR